MKPFPNMYMRYQQALAGTLAAAALCALAGLPEAARAQQPREAPAAPLTAAAPTADVLPSQALGPDDLLQILVPYCPELSRSFRISSDGTLALPLIKQRLEVNGLQPVEVEKKIAAALIAV